MSTFITVFSMEPLSTFSAIISLEPVRALTSGGCPDWFTGGAIQTESRLFLTFVVIYKIKEADIKNKTVIHLYQKYPFEVALN